MRRSPLKSRSTRKAAADREYAKARLVVLERDEHTCQLHGRMGGHHCQGVLVVHHVRRRSQGGGHDPSNLVTLCDSAHVWVHANPAEAALFGLLTLRPETDL